MKINNTKYRMKSDKNEEIEYNIKSFNDDLNIFSKIETFESNERFTIT